MDELGTYLSQKICSDLMLDVQRFPDQPLGLLFPTLALYHTPKLQLPKEG